MVLPRRQVIVCVTSEGTSWRRNAATSERTRARSTRVSGAFSARIRVFLALDALVHDFAHDLADGRELALSKLAKVGVLGAGQVEGDGL